MVQKGLLPPGPRRLTKKVSAYEAPVITIGDGTGPIAPAPDAPGPGLPDGTTPGDVAVVTEYLRILQGMITTGSDIVRGHVAAEQRR